MFNPELVTQGVIQEQCPNTLPDWYRGRILGWGGKECFAIQTDNFKVKRTEYFNHERLRMVEKLRSSVQGQKLSKVLDLLPTLDIKLNFE